MSYGIEIRNANNDIVIDEENEVVLVAEKNTISGTRSSVTSLYQDYNYQWWYSPTGDNYLCCVYLDYSYATPPIVAIRGVSGNYNVLLPQVRMFQSTANANDPIDRLFFRSDYPRSIDYIVCTGASECPATSRATGTETYGIQVLNSSASVIFDSRWPSIVSCTSLNSFPSGVDIDIDINPELPPQFSTTEVKTDVGVTIPSTPAAFFAMTGLKGSKVFQSDETSGAGGEPIVRYGGGYFAPTLKQTNDTTVSATTIRVMDGPDGTAGSLESYTAFSGNFQVLRYLDF